MVSRGLLRRAVLLAAVFAAGLALALGGCGGDDDGGGGGATTEQTTTTDDEYPY
jgi:hypothetical protein